MKICVKGNQKSIQKLIDDTQNDLQHIAFVKEDDIYLEEYDLHFVLPILVSIHNNYTLGIILDTVYDKNKIYSIEFYKIYKIWYINISHC